MLFLSTIYNDNERKDTMGFNKMIKPQLPNHNVVSTTNYLEVFSKDNSLEFAHILATNEFKGKGYPTPTPKAENRSTLNLKGLKGVGYYLPNSLKNSNPTLLATKCLKTFCQVVKNTDFKYTIRANTNEQTTKRIIARLLAFNDIEIQYTDDVLASPLVKKSKKPLWKISKTDKGEYLLERVV